jgi:hypothetical protein
MCELAKQTPNTARLGLIGELSHAALMVVVGFGQNGHDGTGVDEDRQGLHRPKPLKWSGLVLKSGW